MCVYVCICVYFCVRVCACVFVCVFNPPEDSLNRGNDAGGWINRDEVMQRLREQSEKMEYSWKEGDLKIRCWRGKEGQGRRRCTLKTKTLTKKRNMLIVKNTATFTKHTGRRKLGVLGGKWNDMSFFFFISGTFNKCFKLFLEYYFFCHL